MYDQNIAPVQLIHDWYILCYAAKWLDHRQVFFDAIWEHKSHFRKFPRSDLKVSESLWHLLDTADIIVAHNGDQFDVKKIRTSFLKNGLVPCSPFITVDTKKATKRYFGFLSNKLDSILRTLSIGHKLTHTGFDMWLGAMSGNPKACRLMKRYNINDVKTLEKVYLKLRPFYEDHPDTNITDDNDLSRLKCPRCNSKDTSPKGVYANKQRLYKRRRCNECGSWWKAEIIKATETEKETQNVKTNLRGLPKRGRPHIRR